MSISWLLSFQVSITGSIAFEGFEDAAKSIGVTAKYTGQTDTDVAGQVAVLEQVIAQNPKGIAVTAVNSTALADTIDSAIKKGISVVSFDSDSPTSNRSAYLGTGNYAAGQKSAEFLVPLVNNKGKLLFYTQLVQRTVNPVFKVLKTGVMKMHLEFP